MNIFIYIGLLVVMSITYASLFESCLHRFIMHRPVKGLRFAFEKHAQVHHVRFTADYRYHLQKSEDKKKIPMAWWNGPLMVLIASSPAMIFGLITGIWEPWVILTTTLSLYYGAYEYLHWCMHLPKQRQTH